MSEQGLFSHFPWRITLASLVVFVVALVVAAGMPIYLPIGQANSIGLPIIFFPVIWLTLFLWVLMDQHILRVSILLLVICLAHLGLILFKLGVV